MYIKCLILISILFICASCELLTDNKPLEIRYTKTDELNMKVSLSNIPTNVVEYRIKSLTSNDTKVIQQGEIKKRVTVKAIIERDQNYSLELFKTGGFLCNSKVILYLINKDTTDRPKNTKQTQNRKGTDKHKCLDQKKLCNIQIDFENKCNYPSPVIIKIDNPSRFNHLSLQGSEVQTLYFNENEKFSILCHQDSVTNYYNVTWKQHFPLTKAFHLTQQLPAKYKFMLNITLRSMDDGTTVYCTGMDGEISSGFTLKLKEPQAETKGIEKIIFNQLKPVTHYCSEDQNLLSRNITGHFMYYTNRSVEIRKNDNGSIFFCMNYRKQGYVDTFIYEATREIYNEVMYIYEDTTTGMQGSENLALWASIVIVGSALLISGIALLLYKRTQKKDPPLDSQVQIQECPNDVVYAEINGLPHTMNKPTTKEEEPYATIIGVIVNKKTSTIF